jgi:K+ transporter
MENSQIVRKRKWPLWLSVAAAVLMVGLGLAIMAHWDQWFSPAHRAATLHRVLYFVAGLALSGSAAGVRQGGWAELIVGILSLF